MQVASGLYRMQYLPDSRWKFYDEFFYRYEDALTALNYLINEDRASDLRATVTKVISEHEEGREEYTCDCCCHEEWFKELKNSE